MSLHFESIEVSRPAELGDGTWKVTGLGAITVLFGKNGSGKSLLLRSWRDKEMYATHYIAPERTGELTFQPHMLQEELTPAGRRESSTRNYSPSYRQRIFSRVQSYFLARGDYRGKLEAPGSPEEIELAVGDLLSEFVVKLRGTEMPPFVLERVSTGAGVAGIDQLSSGEAQLLTLALDIVAMAATWEIQKTEKRLLLIDEPDTHIHPDLQSRFADFLVRIVDRYQVQVAVATHSTSLLSALGQFGGNRTTVVYMKRTSDSFKAMPMSAIQRELAACLGGHVLMGPLFGHPLLLVEGDDDFRVWSQVPRHHITSFAVIPSNGEEIKKYQMSLEAILGSLREPGDTPAGWALLDADKALPQPSRTNPQKHIRFIALACHETENLYLSDGVLADLGLDWNTALQRILARSHEFGNKAGLLLAANTWDRKSADIKGVIEELSRILDDKGLHWTSRVGKALGRARPTGQLADFLGTSVINSLWPVSKQGTPSVESATV